MVICSLLRGHSILLSTPSLLGYMHVTHGPLTQPYDAWALRITRRWRIFAQIILVKRVLIYLFHEGVQDVARVDQ